jgi:hypothetical protein
MPGQADRLIRHKMICQAICCDLILHLLHALLLFTPLLCFSLVPLMARSKCMCIMSLF